MKAHSFVVETAVHDPTDLNLLWDAGRKCLDICATGGSKLGLGGWRKHQAWRRALKRHYRTASRTARRGGANKAERVRQQVGAYLSYCEALAHKVTGSLGELSQMNDPLSLSLASELSYYHAMWRKHIQLVERRLLKGEQIPHKEKVFSLFEPHTEWINKGKAQPAVELGRNLLVATDQFHFVLYHNGMEGTDPQQVTDLTDYLTGQYGRIAMLSLDRGFYSASNKAYLQERIAFPVLPKKVSSSPKPPPFLSRTFLYFFHTRRGFYTQWNCVA